MKPSPAHRNTAATHHNYAEKMETSTKSLKRKDPFSTVKNQPITKMRDSTTDEGTKVILEAIKKLTDKVDSLNSQIKQNSVMLATMAKAVEFNAAEIKDCKTQLKTTKREISVIKKDNAELME